MDLDSLIAAIEQEAPADPLARISAAADLKDQMDQLGDELVDHFVMEARAQAHSWSQIGEALGVSRQAAQQRRGSLLDRLLQGGVKAGRFQRFTDRARTAVVEAQAAARSRNHHDVGTEHLLLGLYAAGDRNLAVRALERLGVERAAVERALDQRMTRGDSPVRGHIPFTPLAKQTLEATLDEAVGLGHNYIGTEHIVLGLQRVEGGTAAQVLAELGVTYEGLRSAIVDLLAGVTKGKGPAPGATGGAA